MSDAWVLSRQRREDEMDLPVAAFDSLEGAQVWVGSKTPGLGWHWSAATDGDVWAYYAVAEDVEYYLTRLPRNPEKGADL